MKRRRKNILQSGPWATELAPGLPPACPPVKSYNMVNMNFWDTCVEKVSNFLKDYKLKFFYFIMLVLEYIKIWFNALFIEKEKQKKK